MLNKYLALDVGRVRIGLAVANSVARIAAPLPAIANNDTLSASLRQVIIEEQISQLVVGWPRNLQGQNTAQTNYVEAFIGTLQTITDLPTTRQDEAVTSVNAEAELAKRRRGYTKADVDSLSAVYILEDYLQGQTK